MLCFAYKIAGEKKVYTHALPDFPLYKTDKHDDRQLVQKLADVLKSADIIVAHKGDRFDIITTNTRMLFHALDPLPPTKTVDTCKEARRILKLPSNKLDHIGEYFGVGRKLAHTGTQLWNACEDEIYHPKEWRMMRDYNAQDVALLDRVYVKLRPYIRHPNLNIFSRKNDCPKCQSPLRTKNGHRYYIGHEAQRYICLNCGNPYLGPKEKIGSKVVMM
jgi:RNase_H superfamily